MIFQFLLNSLVHICCFKEMKNLCQAFNGIFLIAFYENVLGYQQQKWKLVTLIGLSTMPLKAKLKD